MKYKVDGHQVFDDINDVLDYCIHEGYYDTDDDEFESWVNNTYDEVEVGGCIYKPYDVLESFGDLGAVLDGFQEEMCDREADDKRYELEHAAVGDLIDCQDYTIEIIDDPDEEEESEAECCDADYIEQARKYYDEQQIIMKQVHENEKKDENDLMSLFQVISA